MPIFRPNVIARRAALALLLLGMLPGHAAAATLQVSTTGDTSSQTSCTLRQAIVAMNTASAAGTGCVANGAFGSNDRIEFAAGIDTITLADTANNTLRVTALDLTIDGGDGVLIQRPAGATNAYGLMAVGNLANPATEPARTLRLHHLTLRNGSAGFPQAGGLSVNPNASAELFDCTLDANTGGAIAALDARGLLLERSVLSGNHAGSPAGINALSSMLTPTIVLRHSRVENNVCTLGISCEGGGIGISGNGALRVEHSAIVGNSSEDVGGGIFSSNGDVAVRNSTISGNSARFFGGGIHVSNASAALIVRNSTVADNEADIGGGLALRGFTGTGPAPVIDSSVFADNRADPTPGGAMADVVYVPLIATPGEVTIAGTHALVRHPGGAASNRIVFATAPLTTDPLLQALADNGGGTLTHALGAGSPAIDAGANPDALTFDQRGTGFARSAGAATDIGAFESAAPASDGLCGPAHGVPTTTAPTNGLCAAGLPTAVSGTGPWTWVCAGSDGGNDVFCSAPLLVGVQLSAGNSGGFPATGSVTGESVSLRLEIDDIAATGEVVFCDGGSADAATLSCTGGMVLCANVIVVGGQATCAVPAGLAFGPHTLSAAYGGDGSHGAATSSIDFAVTAAATQTQITLSAAETRYAVGNNPDPVTVSVGVSVLAPGAGQPDGSVLVRDGIDGPTCSIDLATQSSCDLVAAPTAGAHSVNATYQPGVSGRFLTSTVAAPLQVRRQTFATVNPMSSPRYGQRTQVPVHVGHGQSPAVNGTVLVCADGAPTLSPPACGSGGIVLCEAANLTFGNLICDGTPLDVGQHAIVAIYLGNDTNAPSISSAESLTVDRAILIPSLASDTNPSTAGTAILYTLRLPRTGAVLPTGTVDILLDNAPLCEDVALTEDGDDAIASCEQPAPAAGVHDIGATYAGDTRHEGTITSMQQVVLEPSETALSSTPNPSTPGADVALLASVSCTNTPPTGTVTFRDGAIVLCADVALATGSAGCIAVLSAGEHLLEAEYSGDAATMQSIATLQHTVLPATLSVAPTTPLDGIEGTGNGQRAFALSLSAPAVQDVTLHYDLTIATDSHGDLAQDLLGPATGAVTIAAGDTDATLVLPFDGDATVEPDEAFVLGFSLDSPVAELAAEAAAGFTLVLRNDDHATLSPGDAVAAENTPDGHLRFTWVLDAPVQGGLAIDYATQDGTAGAGSDYAARAGTLQHDGDPASQYHIDIALIDDDGFEPDETLRLVLGPVRCTFDDCAVTAADGTGTVLDDDAPASGLAIFVDNGTNASDPGDLPTYRITVVNASDAPALQVPVHDMRPPELLDPLWTCAVNIGGSCDPAAGSGDLVATVNLPPGAQASIELDARVAAFDPTLGYRVELAVPNGYDDPDAGDNSATDVDVLRSVFRDDFEP